MKCWKKTLAFAVVLGWAGSAALAQAPIQTVGVQGSGSAPVVQGSAAPAPLATGAACGTTPCAQPVSGCGASNCCTHSSCFDSCYDDSPMGFWADGTLHILRPSITNNAGLIVASGGASTVNIQNFNFDYVLSPSVTVGYTNQCGLGARFTWFRFQETAKALGITIDPNSDVFASSPSGFLNPVTEGGGGPATYTATDSLFIETYDFDITQSFKVCRLDVTVGAGIRWMHIDQGYGASRFRSSVPDADFAFDSSYIENDANNFSGVGPTLLLEARRPVGCGGLALYANSRIGLVFGSRHESSSQVHSFSSEEDSFVDSSLTTSDSDQLIGFVEIEAGVEWAQQCGRYRPFARVGFEGRGYFGTGNAESGAVNNPTFIGGNLPLANIPSLGHTSDIGLYGFAITAGVKF